MIYPEDLENFPVLPGAEKLLRWRDLRVVLCLLGNPSEWSVLVTVDARNRRLTLGLWYPHFGDIVLVLTSTRPQDWSFAAATLKLSSSPTYVYRQSECDAGTTLTHHGPNKCTLLQKCWRKLWRVIIPFQKHLNYETFCLQYYNLMTGWHKLKVYNLDRLNKCDGTMDAVTCVYCLQTCWHLSGGAALAACCTQQRRRFPRLV